MKRSLILFLLFAAITADAQIMVKNNQVVLGKKDSVYSKIIDEKRNI